MMLWPVVKNQNSWISVWIFEYFHMVQNFLRLYCLDIWCIQAHTNIFIVFQTMKVMSNTAAKYLIWTGMSWTIIVWNNSYYCCILISWYILHVALFLLLKTFHRVLIISGFRIWSKDMVCLLAMKVKIICHQSHNSYISGGEKPLTPSPN